MNLTTDIIIGLIYTLDVTFDQKYREIKGRCKDIVLNVSPLYTGYCFYFARTIYNLLNDITICFCSNHYIIKYANSYYDFRGKIPQNAFGLELQNNWFVPFKDVYVVENVLDEEGIASLSGIVDKEKDLVWSLLEPSLLEEGKIYLKDVLGNTRQRKDTRH